MRFGRSLHRHRVAAWADAYINYAELKTLLSQAAGFTSVEEILQRECKIVVNFLSTQIKLAEAQILIADARWGVARATSGTSKFHGISKPELDAVQADLLVVARHITQLDWFMRTNYESLSRIGRKAASLFDSDATIELVSSQEKTLTTAHSPCGKLLTMANKALEELGAAARNGQDDNPSRSLLLEQCPGQTFSPEILNSLWKDDADSLRHALNLEDLSSSVDPSEQQPRRQSILHAAVIYRAYESQIFILRELPFCPVDDEVADQDYLHRLVETLGRHQSPEAENRSPSDFFRDVLDLLHPSERSSLLSLDALGQSPLHYAAASGLEEICRDILEADRSPGWTNSTQAPQLCRDTAGQTPLDLAVRNGHAVVLKALVSDLTQRGEKFELADTEKCDLLAVAISSRFVEISLYLIEQQRGLGFVSRSGQTVLHMAVEQDLADVVAAIISAQLVEVNAKESSTGRTPLMTACIHGHAGIVSEFLKAGADPAIPDARAWVAKDYAAYLGYPTIASLLSTPGSISLAPKPGKPIGATNIFPKLSAGDSAIFVNLGTQDLFKEVAEVDVTPYRSQIWPVQLPDSDLTLTIGLVGNDSKQEHKVALPIISETYDWPFCFTTCTPDTAVIVFKVFKKGLDKAIGTAAAALAALNQGLGPKRESIVRDFKIPLVSGEVGHVGSVVFTFFVARPLKSDLVPPSELQTMKQVPGTILGGHRGNGSNHIQDSRHLQVTENTLKSFHTAVEHGASAIEFDVQLTKDDYPVIYHDFHLSSAGVHSLNYNEFMSIGEATSSVSSPSPPRYGPNGKVEEPPRARNPVRRRRRSLCAPQANAATALGRLMDHTLDSYPGYHGQFVARDWKVYEPFVSLETLLHNVPDNVTLDIELKYPLVNEAIALGMDTLAPEINHYLDTVLAVTYAHAGPRRRIFFTSFNPDICIALAVKQQTYPILFLNNSSIYPKGDRRATNLQMTTRMAHRFGLTGVVSLSHPFVASPGLVGFIRDQGLYTISWGPFNNDPECVKIQAKAGLDMILADRVRLVRHVLDEL